MRALLMQGAAAVTISLSNQTASKIVTGGTATATYAVNSDGGIYLNGNSSPVENWISDPTKAGLYDVEALLVSGTSPSGSAVGSWISPASASWFLTNAAQNNTVVSCVLTVKIREHSTLTVKATATITISAESDSGA